MALPASLSGRGHYFARTSPPLVVVDPGAQKAIFSPLALPNLLSPSPTGILAPPANCELPAPPGPLYALPPTACRLEWAISLSLEVPFREHPPPRRECFSEALRYSDGRLTTGETFSFGYPVPPLPRPSRYLSDPFFPPLRQRVVAPFLLSKFTRAAFSVANPVPINPGCPLPIGEADPFPFSRTPPLI